MVQTNLENQGKPGKVVTFKVFKGISGYTSYTLLK